MAPSHGLETGISLRFIRQYDQSEDRQPTLVDKAFILAVLDQREIPFNEKLADAAAFLKSRIN